MFAKVSLPKALEYSAGLFQPRCAPVVLGRAIALRWREIGCGLMLLIMALNMLAVVSQKSIATDEIVMIPSSYYHVAKGNVELVSEHPPLAKFIAALPLLFLNLHTVGAQETALPDPYRRFWEDNRALFETICFWARVPAIALTVALGALIFIFARELFGAQAGLLAVALFSLEPTTLANGRVVGTDIPAAFGYLLLLYVLYQYVKTRTWTRAVILGIVGGVACLTKFSMLLAGPLVALVFLVMMWRSADHGHARSTLILHGILAALSAVLVIQVAYFFHSRALMESDEELFSIFPRYSRIIHSAMAVFPYVLPTDFIMGAFWQFVHNHFGNRASIFGMYSFQGWWYYFPVAFALKVPIAFLLLSVTSLGWCGYQTLVTRDRRYCLLLTSFTVYMILMMVTRINIGIRYFLPAYPLLFILGGAVLDLLVRSRYARPLGLLTATSVVTWMGAEALFTYPNYMPYMNQFAVGQPHWRYLSDSNVEWGDDVRGLAEYLHARGEKSVQAALIGGTTTLRYYGIDYINLISPDETTLPKTRYVAIGASYLNGSTMTFAQIRGKMLTEEQRINFFDPYRHRSPETIIGGSIYVYRQED
jgi:4-amino-4-deoxy-L-arabinose transferase-like glycosyltransferase